MQEIHCRRPDRGLSMLDNIVTMEETMVHTIHLKPKEKASSGLKGKA